jgi:serine/threonine-protein kinase
MDPQVDANAPAAAGAGNGPPQGVAPQAASGAGGSPKEGAVEAGSKPVSQAGGAALPVVESEIIPKEPPRSRRSQRDESTASHHHFIGRIINGKYQVQSILGEGGMGVVFKVRHLLLQNKNTFALKILHPQLSTQVTLQARFLREVEIAMGLTHENIIQIRDFGRTEDGLLFYTMDFFSGESLWTIIHRDRPMPAQRVLVIARQILLALAEAHKQGIIHRDLKPDNVLIENGEDGVDRVRVLDFGIAKILEAGRSDEDLTGDNVLGTPRYMSPEQAGGDSIDARSDLYSLGCIIFQMLTGHTPFTGKSTRSILLAHLTLPPPQLEDLRPGIEAPQHLRELVFRLLEKDPEARPATAEAVLQCIDAISTGQTPALPPASQNVGPKTGKLRSRAAVPLWTAVITVLAALSAAFVTGWPSRKPRNADALAPPPAGASALWEPPEPSTSAEPAGASKYRCTICGTVYRRGEKVGGMCHGEPLVEVDE